MNLYIGRDADLRVPDKLLNAVQIAACQLAEQTGSPVPKYVEAVNAIAALDARRSSLPDKEQPDAYDQDREEYDPTGRT